MTKLLEKAIAEIRQLPEDRQNEAAEILLDLAFQSSDEKRLTPEQIADLQERLAAPPEYATDQEVEAAFRRLTRTRHHYQTPSEILLREGRDER